MVVVRTNDDVLVTQARIGAVEHGEHVATAVTGRTGLTILASGTFWK
jgi:hypothetical protein